MTGALSVIVPGIHATVQDLGRFGFQALGVPVSGALDSIALRLVNALVGNAPATAALEFLHQGPTLEVAADSVRVAAAGGEIEVLGRSPRRAAKSKCSAGRPDGFRPGRASAWPRACNSGSARPRAQSAAISPWTADLP